MTELACVDALQKREAAKNMQRLKKKQGHALVDMNGPRKAKTVAKKKEVEIFCVHRITTIMCG